MYIINKEVYISVDIEADGPIPGPNSMLSIGAAAYYIIESNGNLSKIMNKKTFSANLETLDGAEADPDTMDWWAKNKDAWDECRKNLVSPSDAMCRFNSWVNEVSQFTRRRSSCRPRTKTSLKPVFVGYPAGFDFLFVYWYLIKFTGYSPFSFSALDIKSFAMAMMKEPYRKCTKRSMPKRWFDNLPHPHIAEEDAIEQGAFYCNILMENLRK